MIGIPIHPPMQRPFKLIVASFDQLLLNLQPGEILVRRLLPHDLGANLQKGPQILRLIAALSWCLGQLQCSPPDTTKATIVIPGTMNHDGVVIDILA